MPPLRQPHRVSRPTTYPGATEMARRRSVPSASLVFLALLLSLLLSACKVGPNYTRPQLNPPPQYRFAADQTEATSLADAPWWQVFGDPALQALIREAIANNLDVRAAAARGEFGRAQAGIAKSYFHAQEEAHACYPNRQTGHG